MSANILQYLFGDKDSPAVRRDMEHVGKFPDLWLRRVEGSEHYLQVRAPYVFSDREKHNFVNLVSSIRTPTGYSATLQRHVGSLRFHGLKSHDHHVMLQDILPAVVKHMLSEGPRLAIIRLGNLFQQICSKVIKLADMENLKTMVAETLCLFELLLPRGSFDVMTHLAIHLVEEVAICGPVHARWCYGIERYMGVLAQYVRNKATPEASMASRYSVGTALSFCTEYFDMYPHSTRRMWDEEEELRDSGELLMGAHKRVTLSRSEVEDIHAYVIAHSAETEELLRFATSLQFSMIFWHGGVIWNRIRDDACMASSLFELQEIACVK